MEAAAHPAAVLEGRTQPGPEVWVALVRVPAGSPAPPAWGNRGLGMQLEGEK